MLTVQQAQLAMNEVPAFKGNVKTIRTDELVDRAAEDLYPTWEKNRDQWNLTRGDHPCHYLGMVFGLHSFLAAPLFAGRRRGPTDRIAAKRSR